MVEATPLFSLAHLLPCIRELCLHQVPLSCKPQQLSLLHAALAGLKQLEVLTLPSCQALEGIGALGSGGSSSLRRLEVWDEEGRFSNVPATRPDILAGLAQLRGLRRLTYTSFNPSACFGASVYIGFLAASLPSSLESLELTMRHGTGDGCASIIVDLQQGKLHSVEVTPPQMLSSFLQLAAAVLLPGLSPTGLQDLQSQWPPAPQLQQPTPQSEDPQLERLSISGIDIPYHYGLTAEDLATLKGLRQRFKHVDLSVVSLGPCTDPLLSERQLQTAWDAAYALGTVPSAFGVALSACVVSDSLGLQRRYPSIGFPLGAILAWLEATGQRRRSGQPAASGAEPAAPAPAAAADCSSGALGSQQQLPATPEWPCGSLDSSSCIPAAWSVLPLAVQHMASRARNAAAEATEAAAAAAGASASRGGHGRGSDAGDSELTDTVLLHGPFIAALHDAPGAIEAWVDMLEWQIAQSGTAMFGGKGAGAPDAFTDGRRCKKHIRAYQLLPTAGAMLVAYEERVKHALPAAAFEAAALYGCRLSTAAAALEVLPLGAQWMWSIPDKCFTLGGPLQDVLLGNVEQALQESWIPLISDPAFSVRDLFYCASDVALTVGEQLHRELPPMVIMR